MNIIKVRNLVVKACSRMLHSSILQTIVSSSLFLFRLKHFQWPIAGQKEILLKTQALKSLFLSLFLSDQTFLF